ncbi:MAG: RNA polymerase sigma factor [Acidimicrobiia bacterium]
MTITSTIDIRVEASDRTAGTPALVTSEGTALSWEDVFDGYTPALTAFARSRGVREPEDLVQNVFVSAVEQLPGFVGDRSSLRSLLFTIAYRRIADEHRRSYRRRETLVAEHAPRPDPGPTIEQIIDLGESARMAVGAMSVLTDRERQVIQMRILEEASPAMVGKALGLSGGNIRVIQARALAKIRAHLTSLGEKGFGQVMVTGWTLTDFVRCLRTGLPADDVLRPWIEELRSTLSSPTLEVTTLANSATMVAGSATAIERVTEAAHSLISTFVSSGAARIGAVVSVVAMSTAPLALPFVGGAEWSSPMDEPGRPVEVQETVPSSPLQLSDDTSRDSFQPQVALPVVDNPSSSASVRIRSPQPSGSMPDGAAQGDATRGGEAEGADLPSVYADLPRLTNPDLIDDAVEPLVEDVVEPLVTDVAEPVVDDVVEVVEATAEPLVEDVVEPLVADVTDTLDDAVPGLGSLLGGG